MNNSLLQQILGDRRRQRKIMRYVVLGILLLVAINFISNYSLIAASYQGGSEIETEVYSYDAETGEATDIGTFAGSLLVPRDVSTLLFKAGSAETITTNTKPFIYGTTSVQFRSPFTATLLSSGGQSCPLITAGGIYSYTCTQPESFSKYVNRGAMPPEHIKVGSFSSIYSPARYADGLLVQRYTQYNVGLTTQQFGSEGRKQFDYVIGYVTPDSDKIIQKVMPKDVYNANDYLQVFTDNTNPKNTAFVAYNHNRGIGYYFDDINGTAAGKKVQRQYKIDTESEQSTCALVGKKFSCYHGFAGDETHKVETTTQQEVQDSIQNTGQDERTEKPQSGVIEITDFSSGNPVTKTYKSPREYGVSKLYATADGTLFGQLGYALDRLNLSDDNFSGTLVTSYATSVAANSSLNFIQNNKLFEYDPVDEASYLRYSKPGETIDTIVSNGGQLYSLNYTDKDPVQLLNLYQLKTSE